MEVEWLDGKQLELTNIEAGNIGRTDFCLLVLSSVFVKVRADSNPDAVSPRYNEIAVFEVFRGSQPECIESNSLSF